jgi:hypothetical protein
MVTLAEASVLTRNFRTNAPESSIKGGMLWKEAIERVINQPGCVALRYYYGMKDSGAPTLVLVGVDSDGKDIVRGVLADQVWPCPPYCDEPNLLNSPVEHGKWSTPRTELVSAAK